MNHKKIVGIMFAMTIAFGVIGVVGEPGMFGVCWDNKGQFLCDNPLTWIPGEPFLALALSLLFITLPLFFVRREVFLAWAKFASVAFPLLLGVLLYTYNSKDDTSGFNPVITDDQLATFSLPLLFAIISLVIIGIKSWKLGKGRA